MKVTAHGKGIRMAYAKNMCEFLVEHLGLSASRYDLGIFPYGKDQGADGIVVHDESKIGMFINFNQSFHEVSRCIAHEMVHVKQVAKGLLHVLWASPLGDASDSIVFWRGRAHPNTPYLDRPWEIQALQQQDILYRRYQDYMCTTTSDNDTISQTEEIKDAVRKVRRKHPGRSKLRSSKDRSKIPSRKWQKSSP